MWNLAYDDMYNPTWKLTKSASGQVAAVETFSWIPSALLSTVYTADRDLTACLYKLLYMVLTPLTIADDMLRTRRFLMFASQLDKRSFEAFISFPTRQAQGQMYVLAYIDAAEKYNGGEGQNEEITKRFDTILTSVAGILGMEDTAAQRKADLKKWGETNDRRGFKLLRDLVDSNKDFKTLRKTRV
jgi:hypothetical protein